MRLTAEKRMPGETVQNGFSVFAEDAENRRGLKHLHRSHHRGAGGGGAVSLPTVT